MTDLEILEDLEFTADLICAWTEITGHPHPAQVYVKRTAPCSCHANGRVFPACSNWEKAHNAQSAGIASCCFSVIPMGTYVELGPIP